MTRAEAHEWILREAAELLMNPQFDDLTLEDALRIAAAQFHWYYGANPLSPAPRSFMSQAANAKP